MKKENILLFAASGFIAGNLFARTIEKHARLSPRKVLLDIKKDAGSYDGWIEHRTVPFQKFALTHDAYHGGIIKKENAGLVCYEFWADSRTGSILKINKAAQLRNN